MKFNEQNLVIISTLNREEASAFVKFLQSEIARHSRDIAEAEDLMIEVRDKFDLKNYYGRK